MMRTTYTYVTLEISEAAFKEIEAALRGADYQHTFGSDNGTPCIDMHGLALVGPPGMDWHR